MFEPLRLPERPPMGSDGYLDAVQRSAEVRRAAQPWMLLKFPGEPELVATRRTWWMWLVTKLVNVGRWWRLPRRRLDDLRLWSGRKDVHSALALAEELKRPKSWFARLRLGRRA